ncbi:SdpI family protein [Rossellomorea sp. YZS02]|uniref:SdpI family protein n=1 Tax=Rossellomorea sp. YZS02 TaxID=3097358 RepID=UPI002A116396|nr:SdpI family protein [Rossellomorea sp. YZS02]MDX8342376.1 SdpI family protein [Rossellomorea sp. YZS02]
MSNIGVSLTNMSASLLFIGISIPLLLGKIKMNTYYGIRISKSFESDEAWYKVNRYGALQMIVWSVPLFLAGIVFLFLPPFTETAEVVLIFFPCMWLVPPVVGTFVFAKKL